MICISLIGGQYERLWKGGGECNDNGSSEFTSLGSAVLKKSIFLQRAYSVSSISMHLST